jgi:hypothetical protein
MVSMSRCVAVDSMRHFLRSSAVFIPLLTGFWTVIFGEDKLYLWYPDGCKFKGNLSPFSSSMSSYANAHKPPSLNGHFIESSDGSIRKRDPSH